MPETCAYCEGKLSGSKLEPCAIGQAWLEKFTNPRRYDVNQVSLLIAENAALKIEISELKAELAKKGDDGWDF